MMPKILHQNRLRITRVQVTNEELQTTEFNKFSAEISLFQAISTIKLLNSVYKSLIDVCLQLERAPLYCFGVKWLLAIELY